VIGLDTQEQKYMLIVILKMEAEIYDISDNYILFENKDYIGIDGIGHDDASLNTLFIEGKWVDDIKLIKKDSMGFVLLPAVQQLMKDNETKDQQIQTLQRKQ
jgi:hypothetical protein